MNLNEINKEMERVRTAMAKTKSEKLKSDYGKHLKKLEKTKAQYERSYRWMT